MICQYTKHEIIVEIGNYFSGKLKTENGTLLTNKNQEDYHGWGLKNVEESIIDSEGLMNIEIDKNNFDDAHRLCKKRLFGGCV